MIGYITLLTESDLFLDLNTPMQFGEMLYEWASIHEEMATYVVKSLATVFGYFSPSTNTNSIDKSHSK